MKSTLVLALTLIPAAAFALPGRSDGPTDLRDSVGAMSMPGQPGLSAFAAPGRLETIELSLLVPHEGPVRIESPRLGLRLEAERDLGRLVFNDGLTVLAGKPATLKSRELKGSIEKLSGGALLISAELARGQRRESLRLALSPSKDGGYRVMEPGASLQLLRQSDGSWKLQGTADLARFSREKLGLLAEAFAAALSLGL